MSQSELITYDDPKSVISESFITLRTNIQFMNANKRLKSLLVASSLPGEGKSWISSNLAVSFAQLGRKVLLIDADLRKGRISEVFETKKEPGLSNYLSETTEDEVFYNDSLQMVIRKTKEPNLFVIPAGTYPPNPSKLLVSMQMKKLIEVLERNFDMIIIDGTPCELVADSKIISRIVDSTIVVTEYNKTKKETLKKTVNGIRNVGGNIIGIVINKIPYHSRGYYYDMGYYGEEAPESEKVKDSIIKRLGKIKNIEITKKDKKKRTAKRWKTRSRNRIKDDVQYDKEIKRNIEDKIVIKRIDENLDSNEGTQSKINSSEDIKKYENNTERNEKFSDEEKKSNKNDENTVSNKKAEIINEINDYLKSKEENKE